MPIEPGGVRNLHRSDRQLIEIAPVVKRVVQALSGDCSSTWAEDDDAAAAAAAAVLENERIQVMHKWLTVGFSCSKLVSVTLALDTIGCLRTNI